MLPPFPPLCPLPKLWWIWECFIWWYVHSRWLVNVNKVIFHLPTLVKSHLTGSFKSTTHIQTNAINRICSFSFKEITDQRTTLQRFNQIFQSCHHINSPWLDRIITDPWCSYSGSSYRGLVTSDCSVLLPLTCSRLDGLYPNHELPLSDCPVL